MRLLATVGSGDVTDRSHDSCAPAVFVIPLVDSSNASSAFAASSSSIKMYSYGALYRTGVGSTLATILVIVGLYYLVCNVPYGPLVKSSMQ